MTDPKQMQAEAKVKKEKCVCGKPTVLRSKIEMRSCGDKRCRAEIAFPGLILSVQEEADKDGFRRGFNDGRKIGSDDRDAEVKRVVEEVETATPFRAEDLLRYPITTVCAAIRSRLGLEESDG